MDKLVQTVLEDYAQRMAYEKTLMQELSDEQFDQRIDEFLLPVGVDTGQFLHSLIRGSQAKCIVELGASYGYSTIWLADAAREVGGHVMSLELNEDKHAYAKMQMERAGLQDHVTFVTGEAMQSLTQISSVIDFALLDLWKNLYIKCFDLLYPRLASGAYVVADNMIYPPSLSNWAADYQAHVRQHEAVESVCMTIGSGLEVTHKLAHK